MIGRIDVGGGPVGILVSPDSRTLYVADWFNNAVVVIDPRTRAVTGKIPVGTAPAGLAVTPDGGTLLVCDRDDDRLSVIDTASAKRTGTIPVGTHPFAVTLSPDGRRAFTANVMSNDVSVVDIAAGREVKRIPVGDTPYGIAFAAGRGFVTDQHADTVTVFDLDTLEPVGTIDTPSFPEGIHADRDGRKVWIAAWGDDMFFSVDTSTLETVDEIAVGKGPRAFGPFIRRTP